MSTEEAPFKITREQAAIYEARYWKDQAREHERLALIMKKQTDEYWRRCGEMETLLASVGGEIERLTMDHGNEAAVRALVKHYLATSVRD